jgi:hypothetical protein
MMMPAPFADHAEIDEAYTKRCHESPILNLVRVVVTTFCSRKLLLPEEKESP